MQTRAGRFVATLFFALLTACGGGGGGSGSDGGGGGGDATISDSWSPSAGRLAGGLEGAAYKYQQTSLDGSTTAEQTGTTDLAGKFDFGYYQPQTCTNTTDSNGKATLTCVASGNPSYTPTSFSFCGAAVPPLPPPLFSAGNVPAYTAWDFFKDQTSIDNLASIQLMCNSNSGDPLITGIKLAVNTADGQSINLSSQNIQQDAATLQTQAKAADGQAHNWPSAQAVSDFLTGTFRCTRAGLYGGTQWNTATAGYAAQSLSGDFSAFVGFDGHVDGFFDFTRGDSKGNTSNAPYLGSIAFSGAFPTIAPGGVVSFSYTAPASAPLPNLTVNFTSTPYGAAGTYQTADGSIAGSTSLSNVGVAFPKYRFLKENVQYTRPGAAAPETFVMVIDVGYDDKAEGNLINFPALPWGSLLTAPYLVLSGHLDGNTLTLEWYDDETKTTDKLPFTLTLDKNTNTLTGAFPGYNGEPFLEFTADQPFQGCHK
jgi:hypothetical protein